MNLLIEALPIALFFISYKLYNIFVATIVLMLVTLIQTTWLWFRYRRLDSTQLLTLLIIILAGGVTLLLHDDFYIKLKMTVLYWILSLICLVSHRLNKPLVKKMMGKKINLPSIVWLRLNLAWTAFFAILGGVNLWVVYHYSTHDWILFKLYGCLGAMLLFALLQAAYLAPYIRQEEKNES